MNSISYSVGDHSHKYKRYIPILPLGQAIIIRGINIQGQRMVSYKSCLTMGTR